MTLWTAAPGAAEAVADLDEGTPEGAGIPSGAIIEFLDSAADADIDLHSVQIVRANTLVAAGTWAPYRRDDLVLKYSLSKSFTSTCVGIAAAAGLLSVDDPIVSFFPEEYWEHAGPRARSLTVRHLLSMATGHEEDTIARVDQADPVRSFLALEPETVPGTLFTYNNGATLTLSALVSAVTGQRLLDFAGEHLLGHLGAKAAVWDSAGMIDAGYSGLHVNTDTITRLGLTYLDSGSFQGTRIVPTSWVREASAVQVLNADRGASVDWQQGYGFQFWRSTHGFRGDGAYGQFCLVLPDRDMVVVTTGAIADMQSVLDRVWRILLPSLADQPLPDDRAGFDALTKRLAGLTIPLGPGEPGRPDRPAGAWDLMPSGAPADTLHIGALRLTGQGETWTLTIDDGVGRYPVPVGRRWTRAEFALGADVLRLAGVGSWTGPTEFSGQVILINTPHRFGLRCDVAAGRAELTWHTTPLEDRPLAGRALPARRGSPDRTAARPDPGTASGSSVSHSAQDGERRWVRWPNPSRRPTGGPA